MTRVLIAILRGIRPDEAVAVAAAARMVVDAYDRAMAQSG